jgi:nicotinate phosphoribosyltransferase
MKNLNHIYKTNLSLLTDLYQITMAYSYWKTGIHNRESVFHLFYRKNPFGNPYAIACGLNLAVEYLQNLLFSETDVAYLETLKGSDGQPLFDKDFLNFLLDFRFTCDVDAITEGSVVFPHEPLIRVKGPLWQANLVETTLLNIINFSTLIATKASRVVKAAEDDTVLEFGLRRAQGIDGGLTASRAAYIGGCHATSNVAAGMLYDIPLKGTHGHSWVMSWADEMTAFEQMAEAMPNNLTLLVDTFDTIEGVENAIKIAQKMALKGGILQGIRLDSGDLGPLSIEARKMLDAAGFNAVQIVASNDLDEYEISKLKKAGAKIDIWGVGTKLVTAYDQPALGGVYKLAALKNEAGEWDYKMKFSEETAKISNPGILQVRRVKNTVEERNPDKGGKGLAFEDILYSETEFDALPKGEDLLKSVFRKGALVMQMPDIQSVRKYCIENCQAFDKKEMSDYKVSLDKKLILRKEEFITQHLGKVQDSVH